MKIICVTGSVGAGKTYLSKKLAKSLKFDYVDVNLLIKKNKLYDSYDKKTRSYVVDEKKLTKFLEKNIKKNSVIDSHLSHYLSKKFVDLCIVTKCDIKILNNRLKKRKYSKEKIQDNLEVEILDVILIEAKENKHNILVVDTSKGYDIKDIIKYVKSELN